MPISLSIVAPGNPPSHNDANRQHASNWRPAIISRSRIHLQRRAQHIASLDVEYRTVDLTSDELQSSLVLNHGRDTRMDALSERRLFLALNAEKQKLVQLRPELCLENPDLDLLVRLEKHRDRAVAIRRHLAEVFFKLAVSVARSFHDSQIEMDDLVGQACVTLIRSIELFDPSRGFRFSSYATRAIRTELSRFVLRQRKRAFVSMDSLDLIQIGDERPGVMEQRTRGNAVSTLDVMLQQLEQREAHVVRSRFGLNDEPGGCSLQSLADEYGVTRERVRQLERRALRKLREMAMSPERRATFEPLIEHDAPGH